MIILEAFQAANETEQRAVFLDKNAKCTELFRVLFMILENIVSEPDLTLFILCLINGILEDQRTRVKYIIAMIKSSNPNPSKGPVDCIKILFEFLQSNSNINDMGKRELAANTLSILVQEYTYENCSKHAKDFLNWLLEDSVDQQPGQNGVISDICKT